MSSSVMLVYALLMGILYPDDMGQTQGHPHHPFRNLRLRTQLSHTLMFSSIRLYKSVMSQDCVQRCVM